MSLFKKKKKNINETVNRLDYYENVEMTEKFEKTDEGYLKGRAIVSNTGIFNYQQKDGTTLKELRTKEDVGDPESLQSYKMKPVTNNHPKEAVDSENANQLTIGYTGEEVLFDGHSISVPILITDQKMINEIERGEKVALSCGYRADLEDKSGFAFGNNRYNAIQKNIRINHLSIVQRARAGDLAKLKLDGYCINSGRENDSENVQKNDENNKANSKILSDLKQDLKTSIEQEKINYLQKTFVGLKIDNLKKEALDDLYDLSKEFVLMAKEKKKEQNPDNNPKENIYEATAQSDEEYCRWLENGWKEPQGPVENQIFRLEQALKSKSLKDVIF